jgi:hypothetical protein
MDKPWLQGVGIIRYDCGISKTFRLLLVFYLVTKLVLIPWPSTRMGKWSHPAVLTELSGSGICNVLTFRPAYYVSENRLPLL